MFAPPILIIVAFIAFIASTPLFDGRPDGGRSNTALLLSPISQATVPTAIVKTALKSRARTDGD
jgi:hypothetical protein